MAIKIIKPGKKPDTTRRFECADCGCVFEGERGDYQTVHNCDNTLAIAMKCPTCGTVCWCYEAKIMIGESQR